MGDRIMNDLTLANDEIALLMDALDVKEREAVSDAFTSMLFGGLMASSPEEGKRHIEEVRAKMLSGKDSHNALTERIIFLKAKLINIRNANEVNEASSLLRGTGGG
jgi:hypothetical protein